jgi:ethanolamine utilization protein EutQ (cupin superfamily)
MGEFVGKKGGNHMRNYRVFKKGTYELKPFVLDNRTLKDTYEVSLSEYGSSEDLGCGVFKMQRNSFDLNYPNDEVMVILKGHVEIGTENEVVHLEAGDIIQVKEGLKAKVSTKENVEIFYASYPVKSALSALNP